MGGWRVQGQAVVVVASRDWRRLQKQGGWGTNDRGCERGRSEDDKLRHGEGDDDDGLRLQRGRRNGTKGRGFRGGEGKGQRFEASDGERGRDKGLRLQRQRRGKGLKLAPEDGQAC
eukprot:353229-Chlamydomonas_euryale.AAC.3